MRVTIKYFLLLIIVFLSPHSLSKDVCLSLSEKGEISMQFSLAEGSEIKKSELAFAKFIDYAKKDDVEGVLSTYSKYDSSRAYLVEELRKTPSKFSLYKSVKTAEIQQSFKWGDYVVSVVSYDYNGQSVRSVQGFFCSEYACQVSDIFDRPDIAEDLILRFFEQYNFANWKGGACPDINTPSFSVYPSNTQREEIYPLKVFIDVPLESKANRNKTGVASQFSSCVDIIKKQKIEQVAGSESLEIMNNFAGQCSQNMDEHSLVPIIRIEGDRPRLVYMTSAPFLALFHQGSFTKLYQVNDGDNDVSIYLVNGVGSGEKALFLLPLLKSDGHKYFDWDYYGSGVSQSLMTPFFAQYLKRTYPQLFEGSI